MASIPAAYIRLEGVLTGLRAAGLAGWMASAQQSVPRRAMGALSLLAGRTVLPAAHGLDAALSLRAAHLGLREASPDRIAVLAEEVAQERLLPSLRSGALDRLRGLRREGFRVVLLCESLEDVVAPLREELRHVDEVHANRLQWRHGRATGRLEDPLLCTQAMGQWVREHAAGAGIDLQASCALASFAADLPLLEAVGRPVAVDPDARLLRHAQECGWAVEELGP